jgi:hypothetical protein
MLTLTKKGQKLGAQELNQIRAGWGACGRFLCYKYCGTRNNTDFNFSVDWKIWWAT